MSEGHLFVSQDSRCMVHSVVQGRRHAQRGAAEPMRRRPRLCYFAIVGLVNDLLKMKKYYRAKSSYSA